MGATWRRIAKNVSGTSYEWNVPVPVRNRKGCSVRVLGYNSSGVKIGTDKSDGPFTIEVVRLARPSRPGISLTSGDTLLLAWTIHDTSTPIAKMDLYYATNASSIPVKWQTIQKFNWADARTYEWTVPPVTASRRRCKVKIVLRDAGGRIIGVDLSDNYFTIQPQPGVRGERR